MSGTLSKDLTTLSKLRHFRPRLNNLSGSLPVDIEVMRGLEYWNSYGNEHMTGTIPEGISVLTNLNFFALKNNLHNGTIPWQLGDLTKLTVVALADNFFTGTIPESLGQLSKVKIFEISHNLLTGELLLIYIYFFHVLNHLLMNYIRKLHWNYRYLSLAVDLCMPLN